jgi:hypothetical protein
VIGNNLVVNRKGWAVYHEKGVLLLSMNQCWIEAKHFLLICKGMKEVVTEHLIVSQELFLKFEICNPLSKGNLDVKISNGESLRD